MTIRNISTLSMQGVDFRRQIQILTTKDDPRTARVDRFKHMV